MDQQILEHLSAGRIRRDVQALRDTLSGVSSGDAARVVVRSARYGLYVADGVVRIGVGGQPMIADVFLSTGAEIQRIYSDISPVNSASAGGEVETSSAFKHGDVVQVTFSTPTHGEFQISGPITEGKDRFLLVGSWIVFDGEQVAPRVVRIDRFNDVNIHPTNVPPRRTSMEEATPSSEETA